MRSPSPPAEARIPAGGALRAGLVRDVRATAFAVGTVRPPRGVGAEIELIPVEADGARRVPIESTGGPSTLPLLRRHGARMGWTEARTPGGAPLFLVPGGGSISYEPGGQIEFSSPLHRSIGSLARDLRGVVLPLREAAREEGIDFLESAVDAGGPVESVPMQLAAPRYRRMADHFERIGPAGARMMRQTAAMQVSLDWDGRPDARWRVLNAAAPCLVAIFANSPLYEGAPTGAHSYRARLWRHLDPGRTGLLGRAADPAVEYVDFALGAPAILLGEVDAPARPFADWLSQGVGLDEWWLHLTTLFPEVRPKGFAEVRSCDALPPEWYAVPPTLLAGLIYDDDALAAAADLLGEPDPARLERAGECGLSDPALARTAADLFEIGLRGATALGEAFADGESLESARAYFARYTGRARTPADEILALPSAFSRRIA